MEHHSHVKSYLTVYAILLVLVVLTVAVSLVKAGALAFPIAMSIASIKALLIVLIFMHVKDETPMVQLYAFVGVVWLGLFFAFTLADYMTRNNTNTLLPIQIEAMEPGVLHGEHGGHGDATAPAHH